MKQKPPLQMRCALARIHFTSEGAISLIRGVAGALRQMKTLSKNNVQTGRDPASNLEEKWTDVSRHKPLVLVFSTRFFSNVLWIN